MSRQPRLDWADYDALLAAWQGQFGGDPRAGDQRFVDADLDQCIPSPFTEAEDGWILGVTPSPTCCGVPWSMNGWKPIWR